MAYTCMWLTENHWAYIDRGIIEYIYVKSLPGARFTKQTYNNLYPKFLVKKVTMYFRKKYIEKIRLTRKLQ